MLLLRSLARASMTFRPGMGAAKDGGRRAMRKPKINTMEELSSAISVSRPTLSRYFQDPESVRSSTRTKIETALQRVDYVPNFFATRMNRKATGLIGVIIPYLNDLFYTSLLEAIERAAIAADYTVITQSSHGDAALEARAVEKLLSMNADGAIVAPLGASSDPAAIERLSANLPLVFVDSRPISMPDNADFVGTDNRQSIRLIVEYLCRTGPAPVFLRMPRLNSNSQEREAAYLREMERLGHEPAFVEAGGQQDSWDFEGFAYELLDRHFSHGTYTKATILCANDRLAIGAIRAANRHRLFRPDAREAPALRIAGHDDHPLSRYMTPPLTTVSQDAPAIANAAMRMLMQRVRADAPRDASAMEQTFEAALRLRDSA